jgi:hypothetical protein
MSARPGSSEGYRAILGLCRHVFKLGKNAKKGTAK